MRPHVRAVLGSVPASREMRQHGLIDGDQDTRPRQICGVEALQIRDVLLGVGVGVGGGVALDAGVTVGISAASRMDVGANISRQPARTRFDTMNRLQL